MQRHAARIRGSSQDDLAISEQREGSGFSSLQGPAAVQVVKRRMMLLGKKRMKKSASIKMGQPLCTTEDWGTS